uniref:Uncharacterized protein n=1 Tax=Anguilla anguilla TaxID=7936 RepID=A0A0E9SM95_ANGAN
MDLTQQGHSTHFQMSGSRSFLSQYQTCILFGVCGVSRCILHIVYNRFLLFGFH